MHAMETERTQACDHDGAFSFSEKQLWFLIGRLNFKCTFEARSGDHGNVKVLFEHVRTRTQKPVSDLNMHRKYLFPSLHGRFQSCSEHPWVRVGLKIISPNVDLQGFPWYSLSLKYPVDSLSLNC